MEGISKALFAELVQTAAFVPGPDEAEALRTELNRQMDIIRQLEAIPLDEKLSPVIHGNPYPEEICCELRPDTWNPFGNPEEIIQQAPVSKDGCIVSPDVQHQRIG